MIRTLSQVNRLSGVYRARMFNQHPACVCGLCRTVQNFAKAVIHRGAREFIVDLCICPMMDSTFMGTLAAISLWLRELGDGCVSVVNLKERNAESLCSLGLDQLFNVQVSAINKHRQALPIALKEDRSSLAQTMLEAHEALIKTTPENLPKFKEVIQYLKEEL